ncbi:threonine synthase [Fimbriimonas ginsengisoli Gsoil 348]|uniref:Threonine synthase n=1 Tax=Fimbriimonas ginsengisoli Gsoil 348 TaxID=661478 RepID=A0A068NJZ1_FIMGI|nr:threonine synthase [Fimbriimonas ginsengisoli Gsoil 348]
MPPVTLYEGNTPLIPAPRLAAEIAPGAELHLKYEGLNPSGSFKDRGMTTAITQAVSEGARAVICASTGNTAASAAAYAARAGLKCAVLIPEGKVALGKLAGAIAYGADVIAIEGSFDDALRMVREIAETMPIALVNSVNPARLEGQKTAAWEITDHLGGVPDWLCLPVGNAGNITAYWIGFCQNGGPKMPRVLGAQAAGSAPIVMGHPIENPDTIATAIRIGNPARWKQAEEVLRASHGMILAVSDEEILEAQRLVATLEGVYCEPSSAAGLAGLRRAVREGTLDPNGLQIAAVLTGHGMKDPDTTIRWHRSEPPIASTTDALRQRLERK